MSYRDDLAAAHARIAALESELQRARAELEQLQRELGLAADKDAARKAREEAKAHERELRDKMKQWQREAEDQVRAHERELERKRREAEELAGVRRPTE